MTHVCICPTCRKNETPQSIGRLAEYYLYDLERELEDAELKLANHRANIEAFREHFLACQKQFLIERAQNDQGQI